MDFSDSLPFTLSHERLDVYRVAVEVHSLVVTLLPDRGFRVLRDQLERASLGVVLNIAEGAGRRSPADKRRFFEIARGSAMETAAALEIVRLRRISDPRSVGDARQFVIRIVQMLSRLGNLSR